MSYLLTNKELINMIQNHFKKDIKDITKKITTDILLDIIYTNEIPEPKKEIPEPTIKEIPEPKIKETLDTTNHPFKLGTFDYTYTVDDNHDTTVIYTITKITKCFIDIEYNFYSLQGRNGKILWDIKHDFKHRKQIKFNDNIGWYINMCKGWTDCINYPKYISFKKSINIEDLTLYIDV